jgi:hypothetical protein
MKTLSTSLKVLTCGVFIMALSTLAQAQTRTWVSGVGDDLNPCSRTAPCKTFAGAISKTSKDGEIDCLDPGGFGAVTITKSIMIDGTHGAGFGSILAAGTTGVIINITDAADVRKTVRLHSLSINGASTGVDGIRINSAAKVYIEDTLIDGFTNRGISDIRSIAGKLTVTDSTIRNTTQSGIAVGPTGGVAVTVLVDNTRSTGSTSNAGYSQSGNVKASIRNSVFNHNLTGLLADGTGGEITVEGSTISFNTNGLFMTSPAIMRLHDSVVTNNGTSINAAGQVQVQSSNTSVISGNTTNNLPTGTAIVLK